MLVEPNFPSAYGQGIGDKSIRFLYILFIMGCVVSFGIAYCLFLFESVFVPSGDDVDTKGRDTFFFTL